MLYNKMIKVKKSMPLDTVIKTAFLCITVLCMILGCAMLYPYYSVMGIVPKISSFSDLIYASILAFIQGGSFIIMLLILFLPGLITFVVVSNKTMHALQYLWLPHVKWQDVKWQEINSKDSHDKESSCANKYNFVKTERTGLFSIFLSPLLLSETFALFLFALCWSFLSVKEMRLILDCWYKIYLILIAISFFVTWFLVQNIFNKLGKFTNKFLGQLKIPLIITTFILTMSVSFTKDTQPDFAKIFISTFRKTAWLAPIFASLIGYWLINKKISFIHNNTDKFLLKEKLLTNKSIIIFCMGYYGLFALLTNIVALPIAWMLSRHDNIEYFAYAIIFWIVASFLSVQIFIRLNDLEEIKFMKGLCFLFCTFLMLLIGTPDETIPRISGLIVANANLGNQPSMSFPIDLKSCQYLKTKYQYAKIYIQDNEHSCSLENIHALNLLGEEVQLLMESPLDENYYFKITIKGETITEGRLVKRERIENVLYNKKHSGN